MVTGQSGDSPCPSIEKYNRRVVLCYARTTEKGGLRLMDTPAEVYLIPITTPFVVLVFFVFLIHHPHPSISIPET